MVCICPRLLRTMESPRPSLRRTRCWISTRARTLPCLRCSHLTSQTSTWATLWGLSYGEKAPPRSDRHKPSTRSSLTPTSIRLLGCPNSTTLLLLNHRSSSMIDGHPSSRTTCCTRPPNSRHRCPASNQQVARDSLGQRCHRRKCLKQRLGTASRDRRILRRTAVPTPAPTTAAHNASNRRPSFRSTSVKPIAKRPRAAI